MMLLILTLGMVSCFGAQKNNEPETYFLLLRNEDFSWCGYANFDEFQYYVSSYKPLESAVVKFDENKIVEIIYQVDAESGDWVVIDKYIPSSDGAVLRRENLFSQENLRVVQEVVIHQGVVGQFHVIEVTKLDGNAVELPVVDFPEVAVTANFEELPFMHVINDMRNNSIVTLCKE
jgi:hypothetical protein